MPSSKNEDAVFTKTSSTERCADRSKAKGDGGLSAKSEKKFENFDKEMNEYQKELEKWNMTGGKAPSRGNLPSLT